MEKLVRRIVKVGNSAGVVLPREWLNGLAKVELIEEPLDIKKDIFEILSPYLEDLIGIYLVGSYARGEQDKESDVDVVAISKKTKKEIIEGKYNISIYTLDNIKRTLEKDPLIILPRLLEAKPLLNRSLLEELKKLKVNKNSFKEFIDSTKRAYSINKGFFDIDNSLDENNIYSIILRLRGFYIISCLIKEKNYSKKGLKRFLVSHGVDFKEAYDVYRKVKSDEDVRISLSSEKSLKLLNLLKEEIRKYDK